MKIYGLDLSEGAVIENLTAPHAEVFPANPTPGELFTLNDTLYVYLANQWVVSARADLALTGWRDLTTDVTVKGTGSNDPTFSHMFNNLYGYKFDNSVMNQCWANFHINHDYKLGSTIFLHMHWLAIGEALGTVRWGFEYSIAKGHQQEVFPDPITVYVEQATTVSRQHMVAEINPGISSSSLEVDAILMTRIFRDASHPNDTCGMNVFGVTIDCHYEVDRFATKNKAPNFYS